MLIAASLGAVVPVHAKTRHTVPSCKAIRDALAAGKSNDVVAAQMKTTTARVSQCETEGGGAMTHAKKTAK
jgi:hypothetical protein